MDTGKLVAGPFENVDCVGTVRFSKNSKKIAVNLWTGSRLDVETQKSDVRVGEWAPCKTRTTRSHKYASVLDKQQQKLRGCVHLHG